jgi:hypothetical protein
MSERGTDCVMKAAEERHAKLWAELTARSDAVIDAVARGADPEPSRGELLDYLTGQVVPHLHTEERMVYNLARGAGERGLVAAMELDHRALLRQVESLRKAATPLDAAMTARALLLLFALRMEKEERVLLPVLAEYGLDVRELLAGRPEMVGTPSPGCSWMPSIPSRWQELSHD